MDQGSSVALLIVLDSVGIGAAPDAADYGDTGSNTLAHIAEVVGGLSMPTLQRLGLGNAASAVPDAPPVAGVPPVPEPLASYGAMQEISPGKDTTTGHWEIAGIILEHPFHTFPPEPPSFPEQLIRDFEHRTGRSVIGNKAASGTEIIAELGEMHLRDGAWIAYTSADSVFQVAAHENVVSLEELYRACEIARELCDPLNVARVIARPFAGSPGSFHRTQERHDFSMPPSGPTVLDDLTEHGVNVTAVGKVASIFANRGITDEVHGADNRQVQDGILRLLKEPRSGLIFANLIDFDQLYGHRRDPKGYAEALERVDGFFDELLVSLPAGGLLIITADHGNDPTYRGTDHTREYVPLLIYSTGMPVTDLGVRRGFTFVADTLRSFFGLPG